jgi:hypothetical protein
MIEKSDSMILKSNQEKGGTAGQLPMNSIYDYIDMNKELTISS